MKKSMFLFALGLVSYMPAHAQWTHYDTQTAISGVFGAINHNIESAERKKQMEILAQEKAQYEQSFKDAMESAKDYEGGEYWEDALNKCEKLNLSIPIGLSYEYSDFVLDLRYNIGLTKTNKDDGNKLRSDLLQITLGYKFAL